VRRAISAKLHSRVWLGTREIRMHEYVHTPAVHAALTDLRANHQVLLDVAAAMMRASDAALFDLDLMAVFGLKRAVATLAGFASLIEQRNMTCARPLLRVQIDNALRFYAFSLIPDPQKAAREVLAGTHLSKIKDRDGQFLRDAYLVAKLNRDLPWLSTVYSKTSGFVHLSGALAAVAINSFDDEQRQVQIAIREYDDLPEKIWLETIACFREATQLFAYFVGTWAKAKDAAGEPT
jgi:hypothetical protein